MLVHSPGARSTPRTDQPPASSAAAIAAPTRPDVPVTAATRTGDLSYRCSCTDHSTAIAADTAADALNIGPGWFFSAPTVAATYDLLYRLIDSTAWRRPRLTGSASSRPRSLRASTRGN